MLNFNLFSEFLLLSPLFLGIFISVYTYLRLNFYKIFSFKSLVDVNLSSSNVYSGTPIIIYFLISTFISFNLTNLNFIININNVNYILLFCCFFFFKKLGNNNHFIFGSFFALIFSIFILCCSDVISFFFLMEVSTYLFLYLSICQLYFSNYNQKSVINSTLIVFIINFFSSICFFTTIYYMTYIHGFNTMSFNSISSNFFCIFLTLKFLSGPWVYFGVEVYKGYKYITLCYYTILYLVIFLPKVFLMVDFSLNCVSFSLYLLLFFYILVLLSSINYLNSLKMFLSYSTSFNLVYLLLFFLLVKL